MTGGCGRCEEAAGDLTIQFILHVALVSSLALTVYAAGLPRFARNDGLSVVLENVFQRGGIEDVFGPLFELFECGGFQPGLSVWAWRAEAAGE